MENIETIRGIYNLISSKGLSDDANSIQGRVNAIRFLEEKTGYQFKDTKDFHDKMELFLSGYQLTGRDLKRVRKEANLTQADLARRINVSQPYMVMMEKGKKPLNFKALEFMKYNPEITS